MRQQRRVELLEERRFWRNLVALLPYAVSTRRRLATPPVLIPQQRRAHPAEQLVFGRLNRNTKNVQRWVAR